MKKWLFMLCALLLLSGCTPRGTFSDAPSVPSEKEVLSSVQPLPDSSVTSENIASAQPSSDSLVLESGGTDYLETGFYLMDTEIFGGIYYDMPEKDVIALLGEPSKKEKSELWGADGMYHWDYVYKELGVTIGFASEGKSNGKVFSYTIKPGAFDGSTSRNIRIGSKRQGVLDAYANEINYGEMTEHGLSSDTIVAGSVYGGIIFHFSDKDAVDEIFVGAAAE